METAAPPAPPLDGVLNSVGGDLAVVLALGLGAWLAHRLSWTLAKRVVLVSHYAHRARDQRPERRATLQGVVANTISLTAIAVAVAVALERVLDVSPDTIVWTVGLFSVAFGLAARPVLSDVFAGTSLLFEDNYTVDEKVEMSGVIGVVEQVALRTTRVRGETGELFIVPNGEIRVVRNFSRGEFSLAKIALRVGAADLGKAVETLAGLATEAVSAFDEVSEPWKVISEAAILGETAELTLVVKTAYGQGAEVRPRLMVWVGERLAGAGVHTVG
jgi:small conductance mechanosensitive channel